MNFKKLFLVGLLGAGLFFAGSPVSAQKKMIQIKGSDTLVNLVQILSEAYMEKHPDTPIAVLGGGSGTGIAALINGTCDIANHSRPMKEKELNQCKEKGINPRTFVIAVDGVSVIVNGNNPVSTLTLDQIGAVFRGEITSWKAVGGPDRDISLYGRQSNSGTFVFFQDHVLGKQNYSADMKRMNGNAQIVEGVIQDKDGIGYVGVGYIVDSKTGKARKGLKVLSVSKSAGSSGYSPLDKDAVDAGDYPIARALYQTSAGAPKGAVLDFIKFETGPEGQKIVEAEGFFTIGSGHKEANQKNMK
jgi:phosphate transport system substrate-binding protein